MFDDDTCRCREFADEVKSRVEVEDVVVAQLFAVELFRRRDAVVRCQRNIVNFTIESCVLMRVLAVSKQLRSTSK